MPERDDVSAEAVRPPGRRSSLRSARWFAAEIVVVTVGILIALTLDAWWSELKDADRARSYLVRIHEDLSSDGEALDMRLTYFASVQRFAESAIAYAETGTHAGRGGGIGGPGSGTRGTTGAVTWLVGVHPMPRSQFSEVVWHAIRDFERGWCPS